MNLIPTAILPTYMGESPVPSGEPVVLERYQPYFHRTWVTGPAANVRASQFVPSKYIVRIGPYCDGPDRSLAAHPVIRAETPLQPKKASWQDVPARARQNVTYVSPGYYMSVAAPSYDDVRRFMDARTVGRGA